MKDKQLYRERRKWKKLSIRLQHQALAKRGVPHRVNGSKLGLRKRTILGAQFV